MTKTQIPSTAAAAAAQYIADKAAGMDDATAGRRLIAAMDTPITFPDGRTIEQERAARVRAAREMSGLQ